MLRLLASGSCHGCQTTFPITLFSYTSVPLSWYVLSGKKLVCVCVSAELTSMQTCWTVVVSSRHSWMILFLVAVKSLIPVRGVLRADKGGKREHWKQAMDCRDELKFIVLAQIAVFGHRQACYLFLKYATTLVPAYTFLSFSHLTLSETCASKTSLQSLEYVWLYYKSWNK